MLILGEGQPDMSLVSKLCSVFDLRSGPPYPHHEPPALASLCHHPRSADLGPAYVDVSSFSVSQTPLMGQEDWTPGLLSNYFHQSKRKAGKVMYCGHTAATQIKRQLAQAELFFLIHPTNCSLPQNPDPVPPEGLQPHRLCLHGLVLDNGLMNQDHPNGFLLHHGVHMPGGSVHGLSV